MKVREGTPAMVLCLLLLVAGCASPSKDAQDTSPSPEGGADRSVPPVASSTDRSGDAPRSLAGSSAEPLEDEAEEEFRVLLAEMGVRYFPARHELEIDGWVNMREGLVEVFACAPEGKTHEAVVVLDCVPSGLHAGLLALGLQEGTPVEFGTDGSYRPPTGDGVEILVRWIHPSEGMKTARAEDLVWNQVEERPMEPGAWIFAGSFLQDISDDPTQATYAANYVKSLVTTYHDASSILENPHAAGADDTLYYANDHVLPAVGTPLTVVFRPAGE